MTKEMIISSNGHETAVAILEDDLVAEVFIERERQRGVVGNVYKGRVSKVLPGMQSSFIDVGLERDGFLYVADVFEPADELDRLESGDLEDEVKASAVDTSEEPRANGGVTGASSPGTADGRSHDESGAPSGNRAEARRSAPSSPSAPNGVRADRAQPRIEELLHEGQEILVQVVKEPLGTKGARLTSHVTMAGRFLVFMPTVDHVGVSRKIESREER